MHYWKQLRQLSEEDAESILSLAQGFRSSGNPPDAFAFVAALNLAQPHRLAALRALLGIELIARQQLARQDGPPLTKKAYYDRCLTPEECEIVDAAFGSIPVEGRSVEYPAKLRDLLDFTHLFEPFVVDDKNIALGIGAFARVVKAKYLFQDAHVALKIYMQVLDGDNAEDNAARDRIKRDIDLPRYSSVAMQVIGLGWVRVRFKDSSSEPLRLAAIMPLAEGGSVADHLDIYAGQPIRAAKAIARLAHGLSDLHRQHIIHRDIKPANLLLLRKGDFLPVLTDFNLAKFTHSHTATNIAGVSPEGTPNYASPEQARGQAVDHRTDLFSLGVCLYELLEGHAPFAATSVLQYRALLDSQERISFINRARVRDRRVSGSDIPQWRTVPLDEELENIVITALEFSPDRRYQTADAFAVALESYIARKTNVITAPLAPIATKPSQFVFLLRDFFFHRTKTIPITLTILLLSLTAGVWFWQYRKAEAARVNEAEQHRLATDRLDAIRDVSTRFVTDVQREVQRLPGTTPLRRTIHSSIIAMLDQVGASDKDATDIKRLVVRASLNLTDRILTRSGTSPDLDLGEAHSCLSRALGMSNELIRPDDAPVNDLIDASQLSLRLAQLEMDFIRHDEALRLLERSEQSLSRVPSTSAPNVQLLIAEQLLLRSHLATFGDDPAIVIRHAGEAFRVIQQSERHNIEHLRAGVYAVYFWKIGASTAKSATENNAANAALNELTEWIPSSVNADSVNIELYYDFLGVASTYWEGFVDPSTRKLFEKCRLLAESLRNVDGNEMRVAREHADMQLWLKKQWAEKALREGNEQELEKARKAIDELLTPISAWLARSSGDESFVVLLRDVHSLKANLASLTGDLAEMTRESELAKELASRHKTGRQRMPFDALHDQTNLRRLAIGYSYLCKDDSTKAEQALEEYVRVVDEYVKLASGSTFLVARIRLEKYLVATEVYLTLAGKSDLPTPARISLCERAFDAIMARRQILLDADVRYRSRLGATLIAVEADEKATRSILNSLRPADHAKLPTTRGQSSPNLTGKS